jgi:hypothetical protein
MIRRQWLSLVVFILSTIVVSAQVVVNKQRAFPKTVAAGNYSGVTWIGGDRYALVNDKSPTAGFYLMTIKTDSVTGSLLDARCDTFVTNGLPNRDEEGICYVPQTNTLFVSGEADKRIVEYSLDGKLTGRCMNTPDIFKTARNNGGFEALTYNAVTHRFWTTSENTLKADGDKPNIDRKIPNRVRFQSFGDDLQPLSQYWYVSDSSAVTSLKGKSTLGISGLAALDDGRLVVLEREIRKTTRYIGSFVHVKLYMVNLALHQPGDTLQKTLLTEFRTKFNLTSHQFANYEGLCVGPRLADGRQLLLLCADSQNQYKGRLKDWFRTIVF